MAFTSVISVVACPAGRGKYSKILIFEENVENFTKKPDNPIMDRLILSFLETALTNDISSDNSDFNNGDSKILQRLGFIDDGNIVPQSLSRRDYFRFCSFMN